MRIRRVAGATAALTLLFATTVAQAQTMAPAPAPEKVRVRGTIESVDGQMLTVKGRDGATLKIKLADNAPIRAVVKMSLADIKLGSFVGIAGMPQPDGSQKALEVLVFPDALRGTNEGFGSWDLSPGSTMTNANVDSSLSKVDGSMLVLKYKDGEKTIVVSPDTPVVSYAQGTLADLKPGEKIFIFATLKQPDGTLNAANVTVSRDGVNPPM
jgi:Domain of unknown function (DUF5666)